MKNIFKKIIIALILPLTLISPANAEETIYHYGDGTSGTTPPTPAQAAVGGFAVVNPETGMVHGVIAGSIEHFSGNNRTMEHGYMGCPAGCLIIQQSTANQDNNAIGISSQENKDVIYIQERNIFQIHEHNSLQTQTITESVSNSSVIETDISVSRSVRMYEFGVIDFINTNIVEVSPPENTSVTVSATTKEFTCQESNLLCSSIESDYSNTLTDESVYFDKRSTAIQVETKIIAEAKNKIREQLSLILSMLEKWIIN